jgi:hypothetical protein
MSSRKAATSKAAKAATKAASKPAAHRTAARPAVKAAAKGSAKGTAKSTVKNTAKVPAQAAANGASAEATELAARIERDLRDGRLDTLSTKAFQALMAALCKSYGTQLEAGAQFLPLANQTSASPTEVMTTTSALLKAANLAVFELGMWQSWTGR